MPERPELRAMITGFRLSAALNVAAELGLSDLLASGPRTVAELAAESSADEDTLHRLLHALATVGVYDEREDGTLRPHRARRGPPLRRPGQPAPAGPDPELSRPVVGVRAPRSQRPHR